MPKEARIAIIEDHKDYLQVIEEFLQENGHIIVKIATTFPDALLLAKNLKRLKVSIVILDGNLTPGKIDGKEGQLILTAIRKYAPHIKVIGISSVKFEGVDLDLLKRNIKTIGEAVNNL